MDSFTVFIKLEKTAALGANYTVFCNLISMISVENQTLTISFTNLYSAGKN